MSIEERVAELERREAARTNADLFETERDNPELASAIRATGLLVRDFARLFLFSSTASGPHRISCLSCGETVELPRLLATGPVHLPSCALAPKPERKPGLLARLGHS